MSFFDDKVRCVLPWTHLAGSVDGVWGRCCVDAAIGHEGLYTLETEPTFALKPDALGCLPNSRFAGDNPDRVFGLDEAFNSPNLRRTRLTMLAGEPVAACSYCYEREAAGGQSYRQNALSLVDVAEAERRAAATAPDGSVDQRPEYLDIRFGNSCNLRCIMCAYPVSSRWGLEKHPSWAPAHIDPYREDEQLWESLREHAGSLRRLYFAGGEPFMQAGHFRLVDLLIETGAAGHIRLNYHSNMTILPQDFFEKFASFEAVSIGASCDGTGEVFEKIRVGGRWKTFVANVRTVRPYADVWVAVAPQRDNVMHLGDIIDYAEAEGMRIDLSNVVHWPPRLSIQSLAPEEKTAATAYLSALAQQCADRGVVDAPRHLRMLVDVIANGAPEPA
jgi:organic radical activating enzyme